MIEVAIVGEQLEAIINNIAALGGKKAHIAIGSAAYRAGKAARVVGSKYARQIYTIKAGDVKARSKISKAADGALLTFKGPTEYVGKYKAKERKKGVFVSIKKGSGNIVPRSFVKAGRFMKRTTNERLPIEAIYGPSVPQLLENPHVLNEMERRGMEVFEQRLIHELDRLIGG